MTLETSQSESLRRLVMPTLLVVLVCQFLLGFSLHLHAFADCESSSEIHLDYQQLDQHFDQVTITPDKLANTLDGSSELPVILFAAMLLLAWQQPLAGIIPTPESEPPFPGWHASRPLTRAPPIT